MHKPGNITEIFSKSKNGSLVVFLMIRLISLRNSCKVDKTCCFIDKTIKLFK